MQFWTLLMTLFLAVLGQENNVVSDSLRSALDAVSRRQNDPVGDAAGYYGLGSDSEEPGDLDDGQPENIGYGFQKTLTNNLSPDSLVPQGQLGKNEEKELIEQLAMEYLENEFQSDKDANQYYRIGDESKRSVFRERDTIPQHYAGIVRKMSEGVRKRGPTSFRERTHHVDTAEDMRRRFAQSINRRLEAKEEQEQEFEDSVANEEEYPHLIQTLYDRYRDSNPSVLDIEDLSDSDVEEILSYLSSNNAQGKNVDIHKKKRNKQRLDEADVPDNAFLYSLKFVSPDSNREAVEQLRDGDGDGVDFSGEKDPDVMQGAGLKPGGDYNPWIPVPVDQQGGEEYGNDELSQALSGVPHQHQRRNSYLYDRILLKHKRFPVRKRSSNYYTSPPVLHHHVAGGIRKKKDVNTDPKVATELSQIFAPSDVTVKIVPQIIGNHVVTKQKAVLPITPPPPKEIPTNQQVMAAVNEYLKKNITVIEDKPTPMENSEEIELPVTMSRLEIPIEVKKKSIDWTDYFGLDRRRKKTGPKAGPSNKSPNDAWLLNEYYKTVALSGKHENKKALPNQPFDTRIYDAERRRVQEAKKSRVAETDESHIDSMDSKLRGIEDLIVHEAVKYTGAHEGSTDAKEIQDVKDKVMSRLATAYNLEKMRRALAEFKTSLAAQKASKYNPERLADFAAEKKEAGYSHAGVESMSEGFMGGIKHNQQVDDEECPILNTFVRKCQHVESNSGDHDLAFLPLCTMQQICLICGQEVGAESAGSCDGMFLTKADAMCNGDIPCQKAALRILVALDQYQPTEPTGGDPTLHRCYSNFCASNH